MPFNVGPMELMIVLVLALVILGPKRLPEAGKAVGKGMREFRQSISGHSSDEDDKPDAIPASAQTAQAQAQESAA